MSVDAYEQTAIVRDFASRQALTPAEFAALGDVWPRVRGDVLDIGVGGGRTTGYLLGPARSYRAIDISSSMVEACRQRYPQARVEVDDARSLASCEDAAFDLVLFSFNGIDYIDHAERALVLAAVMRVLRPGGALVYSSHNLRVLQGRLPEVQRPDWVATANPARMAVRAARYWQARWRRQQNRRRLGGQQRFADGYAVVNDEAYDHALLTVYVDPDHEMQQLSLAGFADIASIDTQGRRDQSLRDDPWVYYVAFKPVG